MNIDFADVISRIGTMNRAELDQVQSVLTMRSKYLREQATLENKATLQPGDRVVTGKLTPKYLAGLPGTVVPNTARRAKDVTIKVDEDFRYLLGKYGNQSTGMLNVPAGALVKQDV
jgi:hypothetical protein